MRKRLLGRGKDKDRLIDANASRAWSDLHTRFSLVRKSRTRIWLVAGIIFFILGFILAFLLVINPSDSRKAETALQSSIIML
jgi:hypothetical protein